MRFFDWFSGLFRIGRPKSAVSSGVIEKTFGVRPAASQRMEDNQNLWWAMYTNHPPWETDCVRPLGLPGAVGRELARHVLTEFSVSVSGSARANYINQQLQTAAEQFETSLELGLCLGGAALKPYPDGNRILVETKTVDFTPTRFDGTGKAIGGVFKSRPVRQGNEWFVRLEYHDFVPQDGGTALYVIENRAFRSSEDGTTGAQVPLDSVREWRELPEHAEIEDLEGPLFAYFKPPVANRVEPNSDSGVSVYSGEVADLIRQADEQWELIRWEFQSGQRKIISDSALIEPGQLNDRLFVKGPFTSDGNLFETFSPEYRSSALYDGFQYILKIIEFCTGLAFGTLSDPQSVNKTATEEIMTKHRQYVTEDGIQKAFQKTLDGLIYAMNAWCDLAQLSPAGAYAVDYQWGDGVLDDPETRRQDKAMDAQLVSAGLMNNWEFRMKWYNEDEKTARAMLPGMEDLALEPQNEVE